MDDVTIIQSYPAADFYLINIIGMVSLALSIFASTGVVIYMCLSSEKSFYLWTLGERLIVYLQLFDLAYSLTRSVSVAWLLSRNTFIPGFWQIVVTQLGTWFALGQWFMVLFFAVNVFLKVTCKKTVVLGRYDWILMLGTLGTPLLLVGATYQEQDFVYARCFLQIGQAMGYMLGAGVLLVFVSITALYIMVGVNSLRRAESKYRNSVTIMLLFSVAFIAQYWPHLVFLDPKWAAKSSSRVAASGVATPGAATSGAAISGTTAATNAMMNNYSGIIQRIIDNPATINVYPDYTSVMSSHTIQTIPHPTSFCATATAFWNLGGVFNCIAYTLVRRQLLNAARAKRQLKRKESLKHMQQNQN